MQVILRCMIAAAWLLAATPVRGEPAGVDLRLTLSTFLYREAGGEPVADPGTALANASPVARSFGDLRTELSADGLALDARLRQTTGERYQSGAGSGGEYEIRTLAYRLGSDARSLTVGRQFIDAVGATRVDGLAATRGLTDGLAATVFAGAYPELGSRSLATDYVRVDGARVVPLTGGIGVAYQTPSFHGDLGAAAIYVGRDGATTDEQSRVIATSSGYGRIGAPLDVYHFAELDVTGAGAHLTNASLGLDLRPTPALQLSASLHHVSNDLLQIAARDLLRDPDPSAGTVVLDDLEVVRISQDVARATASLALVDQRFELSASGGVHRHPSMRVPLADGSTFSTFPEARSADATFAILDRRAPGGLRAQLSGSVVVPLGGGAAPRTRGAQVRLSGSRTFAAERGQLEADVMAERFHDVSASTGACLSSTDPLACFGTSTTTAVQAGVLASWRIGREWLVLADAHVGARDARSTAPTGPLTWPRVYSIASFVRMQWRIR